MKILKSTLWIYLKSPRDGIFKLLRSTEIDFKESIPPAYVASAGIFEQYMGARDRVGIELSYRPPSYTWAGGINSWNRFLCSTNVLKYHLWRADTTTLFLLGSWPVAPHRLPDWSKTPALAGRYANPIPTRFLSLRRLF
jgi:hypothetical protein